MGPVSLPQLDKKDRTILSLLDFNCRMSHTAIGKKVGLSKKSVKNRINKYLEKGIVKGFYTVIDTFSLGYMSAKIYVKLKSMTKKQNKVLLNFLKQEKNIWFVSRCDGYWHMEICYFFKSNEQLDKLWEKFHNKFANYLTDFNFSLTTNLTEFNRLWLNPNVKRKRATISSKRDIDIDNLDFEILKYLSENARASYTDIGSVLDVSYKTIGRRIQRMRNKKIILAFRTILNTEMLGYKWYHINLKTNNLSTQKKLETYCTKLPSLIYLVGTINDHFEFEIEVKDEIELRNIIENIKINFPGGILDHSILNYYEVIKMNYFPEI